jgi:predicted dehydrogenase
MMGDQVVEVFGYLGQRVHNYLECEDIGVSILKFKNGSVATIEGTTNVYPKNLEETLCLFGETGTVKISGTSCNNVTVWDFKNELDTDLEAKKLTEETSNVYGNGHTSLYRDMVEAIENNRNPYVDGEAGKNALEIVLAIYKSQLTGAPVKLPLKDFGTEDMVDYFENK